MVNRPTLYIEDIEQICDETIEEYGALPVIAIDSLQAVRSRKSFDNRYAETAEITRTLKALSVKYNTRLVVRSNLNRNLELRADKRPVLFDLRDSGTIEDDATMVIFSYVESVYVPDECFDGVSLMEAIVAKNDGGRMGTATLLYSAPYSRADNYCEPESADVVKFPTAEKEEE
ncbi:DnaB-like helicase C-terminal domain-containing protein [Vibrio sp.]|uniref:DnaB-like helicase C-terminal domain-containing protein n=1 Tax=Vibrio sp. TaxID=678 RepID=UPI0037940F78